MSSRVFQSVIVQMKEATDRMIGVIDADANVISCSDTSMIGEKWATDEKLGKEHKNGMAF